MTQVPVVVIGGGMSGLAAARTLDAAALDALVIERASSVGGRVLSTIVDGTPVDLGAQFIAPFCNEVLDAARATGLTPSLRLVRQAARFATAARSWEIDGLRSLTTSSFLTVRDRLRLAALVLPVASARRQLDPHDLLRAAELDDASAEAFARRWAGDEATERFIAPLVRGLTYWELRSASRAMLMLMLRVAPSSRDVHRLDGGLHRLPAALAARTTVRCDARAVALERRHRGWRVHLASGEVIDARGVVCATTASTARELSPLQNWPIHPISYSRSVAVTVRLDDAAAAPAGTTLVVGPQQPVLASVNPVLDCGAVTRLVRICSSDTGARMLDSSSDDAASEALVVAAVAVAPWLEGATSVHVHRWAEALPRFPVGALRSIRRRGVLGGNGLVFAGDYLGGPSLEGAFSSGRRAAEWLIADLTGSGPPSRSPSVRQ